MSLAFATERRRLTEAELEPIQRSHFPLLEGLSREEVQESARWLRSRRDRVRTRRATIAGRSAARPLPPRRCRMRDRGLAAKKQVFAAALKRVNARLDALLGEERRARNLERLRQALTRRQAASPHHPAAGSTPHAGTRSLPSRRARPTIHAARVGSTSQAGRNAPGPARRTRLIAGSGAVPAMPAARALSSWTGRSEPGDGAQQDAVGDPMADAGGARRRCAAEQVTPGEQVFQPDVQPSGGDAPARSSAKGLQIRLAKTCCTSRFRVSALAEPGVISGDVARIILPRVGIGDVAAPAGLPEMPPGRGDAPGGQRVQP